MKYKKEVDELIRYLIHEPWMSEEDYKEVEKESMIKLPNLKEQLNKDLEDGVKNGHSILYQMGLSKQILQVLKSQL